MRPDHVDSPSSHLRCTHTHKIRTHRAALTRRPPAARINIRSISSEVYRMVEEGSGKLLETIEADKAFYQVRVCVYMGGARRRLSTCSYVCVVTFPSSTQTNSLLHYTTIRSAQIQHLNYMICINTNTAPTLSVYVYTIYINSQTQLYEGAIYLHQGESHLVTDVDLAQRIATLRRQDVTYYTQVCFFSLAFLVCAWFGKWRARLICHRTQHNPPFPNHRPQPPTNSRKTTPACTSSGPTSSTPSASPPPMPPPLRARSSNHPWSCPCVAGR